jgi:CheY-like chemotaxis protein
LLVRTADWMFDDRWEAGPGRVTEVAVARIVVADNDLDALDLALTDLRLEGHEVFGALDAEDALELVGQVSPDVVVLDHRMPPGITGLDLAERLLGGDPDLRVVIYSNYQRVELRARATELGVPFLAKGNLRALRAAVRQP